MSQDFEATDGVAVTFVRSGLMLGGQVHLEHTWALVPPELAAMGPDEQIAEYGAQFFEPGIAQGAAPATESYLAPYEVRTPPVYLTTREVADLLRVSVDHVRRMVREGKIEAKRVSDAPNAHLRFRRSRLTRWLGPRGQMTDALGRNPVRATSFRYEDGPPDPLEPPTGAARREYA